MFPLDKVPPTVDFIGGHLKGVDEEVGVDDPLVFLSILGNILDVSDNLGDICDFKAEPLPLLLPPLMVDREVNSLIDGKRIRALVAVAVVVDEDKDDELDIIWISGIVVNIYDAISMDGEITLKYKIWTVVPIIN